jgi:hypothetical protein
MFLKFLQSSSGESSSKRLAFLVIQPFIIIGFFYIISRLTKLNNAEMIGHIWNGLLIYCAFLGGMVTSEIILAGIKIWKGDKKDVE